MREAGYAGARKTLHTEAKIQAGYTDAEHKEAINANNNTCFWSW